MRPSHYIFSICSINELTHHFVYRVYRLLARSNLVSPRTQARSETISSPSIFNLRPRRLNHMQTDIHSPNPNPRQNIRKSLEQATTSPRQRFLQTTDYLIPWIPRPIVPPVILISGLFPGPVTSPSAGSARRRRRSTCGGYVRSLDTFQGIWTSALGKMGLLVL